MPPDLDHPADVQLHSWGRGVEEAFEQAALAMFNYMTPLKGIEVDESLTRCLLVSPLPPPMLCKATSPPYPLA